MRRALAHASEVLVVDDGSSDDTAGSARAAGAWVVHHQTNMGKGSAVLTGLRCACERGHEVAVILDGDGQHDPDEIPGLLHALEGGADLVIGCRMRRPDGMPLDRLLTNRLMSAVLGILTQHRIRDTQSGFKALRIDKVRSLNLRCKRFDGDSELIIAAARGGLRMREVDIKSIYRNHHRSKINVVSDTIRFVRLILSNIVS